MTAQVDTSAAAVERVALLPQGKRWYRNYTPSQLMRKKLRDARNRARRRCQEVSDPSYCNYGARGITFYEGWNSLDRFIADMPGFTFGLTIGRIDNDGPYAPWNCRWETRAEQQHNTRQVVNLCFNGETMCIAEWARRLGVTSRAIKHQLARHGDNALSHMAAMPRYAAILLRANS